MMIEPLTPDQHQLHDRVFSQWPELAERTTAAEWREFEDGSPVLWLDHGAAAFRLDGDLLHAFGPEFDQVLVLVFDSDGEMVDAHAEPNPYSAQAAALN